MDLQNAQSFESMKALAKLAQNKLTDMFVDLDNCANDTGKLQALNESYKEKLGPRGPKKPKDCPGQLTMFDNPDDTSSQGVHDPSTRVRQ
jgi:hypothetical protein